MVERSKPLQQPAAAFSVETVWIREYARTYVPTEAAFSFPSEALKRAQVTLVEIRNVLRSGEVTYSDKLDDPGAIWVVEGDDGDGRWLVITLHVITNALSVILLEVEALQLEKDDNNGAA